MSRAIGLAIVLGLIHSPAAGASAATWEAALAAETDTVVFIAADGALWKAPFHLAVRETLWSPRGEEQLSRLRSSPDGPRVAWISRADDADTTRLWIGGRRQTAPRARYFAPEPRQFGSLHFEPRTPTVEDPDFDGARWLTPNAMVLRPSANPLAWLWDGSSVVFGTQDDLAVVAADSGRAREVCVALIIELHALDPTSLFLGRVMVQNQRGQIVEDWHLIYPFPGRWRLFPAFGLDPGRPWTASSTTVWWASGAKIRAVRVHDPAPTVEVESQDPVPWLHYDPSRRELQWAAGRRLFRRAEEGGAPSAIRGLGSEVQAVLEPRRGALRGLVTADSLLLWENGTDGVRALSLGGLSPVSLLVTRGGEAYVAARRPGRKGPVLARADTSRGVLAPIETPNVRGGLVYASPSGAYIVLAPAGPRVPETFQVYDTRSGTWTEVVNPGFSGWELLEPR